MIPIFQEFKSKWEGKRTNQPKYAKPESRSEGRYPRVGDVQEMSRNGTVSLIGKLEKVTFQLRVQFLVES